jgi:uncharacterized phage-associated protein
MLSFRFDFDKTVQAACLLLRKHDGCMSYLRLLKLLYIVDRELLAETGRTLTGDRPVAMKNGPVLSTLYDIVKQQSSHSARWETFIVKAGFQIKRVGDPGLGKLSRGEASKLEEVTERYHSIDDWELAERTHAFPEWQQHFQEGTARSIPWDDVLIAQGKGDVLSTALKDEMARRVFDSVFGG